MASDSKSPQKPRYITPPNTLKQKVGSGGISEELLKKSQKLMDEIDVDFLPYAKEYLEELSKNLNKANQANDNSKETKEKIIRPVMQLKANGGMFGYQLVSDVADIALQFLEAIEDINNDMITVVNAHEKTINTIIAKKLKGDGGNEGYALVKELHNMCTRYFKKHAKKKKKDK